MIRILCVEDEADIREILVEELEDEGFEVASACNGEEGYQKLASFKPDLVITGWLMPVMTGIQLIRRMRQASSGFASLPVILVSAYTAKAHIDEALRIGACRFVTKPVDFADLLKTIREISTPAASGPALGCLCATAAIPAKAGE